MHFYLEIPKGIFIVNEIKIDAADISKPKLKNHSDQKSFFLSVTLFEIFLER